MAPVLYGETARSRSLAKNDPRRDRMEARIELLRRRMGRCLASAAGCKILKCGAREAMLYQDLKNPDRTEIAHRGGKPYDRTCMK